MCCFKEPFIDFALSYLRSYGDNNYFLWYSMEINKLIVSDYQYIKSVWKHTYMLFSNIVQQEADITLLARIFKQRDKFHAVCYLP